MSASPSVPASAVDDRPFEWDFHIALACLHASGTLSPGSARNPTRRWMRPSWTCAGHRGEWFRRLCRTRPPIQQSLRATYLLRTHAWHRGTCLHASALPCKSRGMGAHDRETTPMDRVPPSSPPGNTERPPAPPLRPTHDVTDLAAARVAGHVCYRSYVAIERTPIQRTRCAD
jgi:hypothetical protein